MPGWRLGIRQRVGAVANSIDGGAKLCTINAKLILLWDFRNRLSAHVPWIQFLLEVCNVQSTDPGGAVRLVVEHRYKAESSVVGQALLSGNPTHVGSYVDNYYVVMPEGLPSAVALKHFTKAKLVTRASSNWCAVGGWLGSANRWNNH
jgi:hypothetical protein